MSIYDTTVEERAESVYACKMGRDIYAVGEIDDDPQCWVEPPEQCDDCGSPFLELTHTGRTYAYKCVSGTFAAGAPVHGCGLTFPVFVTTRGRCTA